MNFPQGQGYREGAGASVQFPAMAKTTRTVYLVLTSVMSLAFVAIIVTWTTAFIMAKPTGYNHQDTPDEGWMLAGGVAMMILVALLYGQLAAGLVWIYKAWSWLPMQERYTRHWRGWISPSQASLFMLIPYFNYYWMFVANCGLCDSLDRLRLQYPTTQAAPKNLAIAACICQFVVPFPVGAILWLVYMSKIERMTKEMSSVLTQRVLPV